jgi:hypothetical protein
MKPDASHGSLKDSKQRAEKSHEIRLDEKADILALRQIVSELIMGGNTIKGDSKVFKGMDSLLSKLFFVREMFESDPEKQPYAWRLKELYTKIFREASLERNFISDSEPLSPENQHQQEFKTELENVSGTLLRMMTENHDDLVIWKCIINVLREIPGTKAAIRGWKGLIDIAKGDKMLQGDLPDGCLQNGHVESAIAILWEILRTESYLSWSCWMKLRHAYEVKLNRELDNPIKLSMLSFMRITFLLKLSKSQAQSMGKLDWWPLASKDELNGFEPHMIRQTWQCVSNTNGVG